MAKLTENAILDCFLQLLEKKSLDKITVKDICEICEINRNTFYYHFADVYDVLDRLFDREMERFSLNEEETFLEEYNRRAAFIINSRRAVMHVYTSKHGEVLNKYVDALCGNFVGKYVAKEAEGTALSDGDFRFICAFYESALRGIILRWLSGGATEYEESLHQRFSDAFYATIHDMIASVSQKK